MHEEFGYPRVEENHVQCRGAGGCLRVSGLDPVRMTNDYGVLDLALHLARQPAAGLDVPAVLRGACIALPNILGVAGAVIMLAEPPDATPTAVSASDVRAQWIGDVQRRAGSGPLPNAIRSGRSMLTPDMTRLGPPEVAAAAAESGLTGSMVVLLALGAERFGALQLLGIPSRPVDATLADVVRPLVEVLVARLADVRALRLLAAAAATHRTGGPPRVDPADIATAVLTAVGPVVAVPSPRRPESAARHAVVEFEVAGGADDTGGPRSVDSSRPRPQGLGTGRP